MGFGDVFKRITGYEEHDVEEEETEEATSYSGSNSSFDDDYTIRSASSSSRTNGKVLNIPATTRLSVVVVRAEKFTDSAEIADHFKSKRAVVINLDNTNKDVANRIIDFLGGVAYAADGDLKRIANTSYILVPYNVDISGDMIEELGNSAANIM